jgi:hypothetical protein
MIALARLSRLEEWLTALDYFFYSGIFLCVLT